MQNYDKITFKIQLISSAHFFEVTKFNHVSCFDVGGQKSEVSSGIFI